MPITNVGQIRKEQKLQPHSNTRLCGRQTNNEYITKARTKASVDVFVCLKSGRVSKYCDVFGGHLRHFIPCGHSLPSSQHLTCITFHIWRQYGKYKVDSDVIMYCYLALMRLNLHLLCFRVRLRYRQMQKEKQYGEKGKPLTTFLVVCTGNWAIRRNMGLTIVRMR
jgi:hypothetical protein